MYILKKTGEVTMVKFLQLRFPCEVPLVPRAERPRARPADVLGSPSGDIWAYHVAIEKCSALFSKTRGFR